MFAVFADTVHGEEMTGRGDTPQMAWENMLGEFAVDEEDIELDTVQFYRFTEDVSSESNIRWFERDIDEEEL